jgi:aryl-alcohol dehydrogenase-like predicted oxidoreductase
VISLVDNQRISITEGLALGTAQLGMRYGIANVVGRPDARLSSEIIAEAYRQGVRFFDTAQDYGESETVLGEAFAGFGIGADVRVITKLSSRIVATGDINLVRQSLETSLRRLNVASLWAVLLHGEMQLDQLQGWLGDIVRQAKEDGLLQRFGVSVYAPERALQALETEAIDVVQVPCNAFDRRMRQAGVFERARDCGKSVFVRSVYLQGLALLEPDNMPIAIPGARNAVRALIRFCDHEGVSRQRFAISYIRWMAPESPLVIGAESVQQLVANCGIILAEPLPVELHRAWEELYRHEHPQLIDPRTWPRT